MRRTFKFEGQLDTIGKNWGNTEVHAALFAAVNDQEHFDGVKVKVTELISPETIQKASNVLKAVAETALTDHDKQILEVAAGILEGVGERNT